MIAAALLLLAGQSGPAARPAPAPAGGERQPSAEQMRALDLDR
jgi:hypothetical protein